jgi:oxaloacetate decarboxylase alpha subunit
MSKLKITETVLRDGHQSQIATRLKIEEILPIIETMDEVGYHALEMWGGATFDVCLRYLNENPWERLRLIKEKAKKTKLQMLLRGQNLLGYKHYSNDIVEKFIQKSIYNGIDIVRIFDALNDVRNLKKSIEVIKRENAHCQCAISYTTSKVHTIEYYAKLAKTMENMGADSICIKDMAGILTPDHAFNLVSELKSSINVPIELHGHCTSGIIEMTYMKAIEAGVDIVDTAISSFSGGTSQPCTESLNEVFKNSERAPQLNEEKMKKIATHFSAVKETYIEDGTFNPRVMKIEPQILKYQVPGGMLSNLLSQLKAQKAEARYEEVLNEIPKVREDLGFPPLVTPLSQMVGTQAVFNVLTGERYRMIPKEIREYVRGFYGLAPVPIKEEIKKKIIGEEAIIDYCPADKIEPMYEKAKKEIADLTEEEEMILAYAIFPDVTRKYLEDQKKQINNEIEEEPQEDTYFIDIVM